MRSIQRSSSLSLLFIYCTTLVVTFPYTKSITNCDQNTKHCILLCDNNNICSNTQITCPNDYICDITCNTFESCYNTTINATHSSYLNLNTKALSNSGLTIYLPKSNKNIPNVYINDNKIPNNNPHLKPLPLKLYTINGWKHINKWQQISNYNGKIYCKLPYIQSCQFKHSCCNKPQPQTHRRSLLQITAYRTITDPWDDDYQLSPPNNMGWTVKNEANQDVGIVTANSYSSFYHGPFKGDSDVSQEKYYITQHFRCNVESQVTIKYLLAFCETGNSDYVSLYMNHVLKTTTTLSDNTGTPYDDALWQSASNCNSWEYFYFDSLYWISNVAANELFKIHFEIGINWNNGAVGLTGIQIICKSITISPTAIPTNTATTPTNNPIINPTISPITPIPSKSPTASPTNIPSISPTPSPTMFPTPTPTNNPIPAPTNIPTPSPTNNPTPAPTYNPSIPPTKYPTKSPTTPSPTLVINSNPTSLPTPKPSHSPTLSTESVTLISHDHSSSLLSIPAIVTAAVLVVVFLFICGFCMWRKRLSNQFKYTKDFTQLLLVETAGNILHNEHNIQENYTHTNTPNPTKQNIKYNDNDIVDSVNKVDETSTGIFTSTSRDELLVYVNKTKTLELIQNDAMDQYVGDNNEQNKIGNAVVSTIGERGDEKKDDENNNAQDLVKNVHIYEEKDVAENVIKNEEVESSECVVCMDKATQYACIPCGHHCLCETCKDMIDNKCPICMTTCTVFKIFK